jgi:hypothetical protein
VLAEDFLPVDDVSDEVATVVDVDPQTISEAAEERRLARGQ